MKKIEYLAFGFSVGSQCGVVAECLGSLEERYFQKCHYQAFQKCNYHDFQKCHYQPILILIIVRTCPAAALTAFSAAWWAARASA